MNLRIRVPMSRGAGSRVFISQDVTAVIQHSTATLDIYPFEYSNNTFAHENIMFLATLIEPKSVKYAF